MLHLLDRRILLTAVATQPLVGCLSMLLVDRNGGTRVDYERLSTAKVRLWQDSVTEFGQDISVVLGRVGGQKATDASPLEREIVEILKLQYATAGELIAAPFGKVDVVVKTKTPTILEIGHASTSATIKAKEVPPDGRKLLTYFGLSGEDYSWSITAGGTLRYTTLTPTRYSSRLDATVKIVRDPVPKGADPYWITQSMADRAALQFGKETSARVARKLERRYGLARDTIKINAPSPGSSII